MASPLSVLGDFVNLGTSAYASVMGSKNRSEELRLQYAQSQKELDYQIAREKTATAQAAAIGAKNLMNSELIGNAAVLLGVPILVGVSVTWLVKLLGIGK